MRAGMRASLAGPGRRTGRGGPGRAFSCPQADWGDMRLTREAGTHPRITQARLENFTSLLGLTGSCGKMCFGQLCASEV